MNYKDFGQGVLATMLLAGATVLLLVNEGRLPEPQYTAPASSAVSAAASAQIRQQASENFQRTSVDPAEHPADSEQISWVF